MKNKIKHFYFSASFSVLRFFWLVGLSLFSEYVHQLEDTSGYIITEKSLKNEEVEIFASENGVPLS